jgi:hypothetical protein
MLSRPKDAETLTGALVPVGCGREHIDIDFGRTPSVVKYKLF